MALLQGYGCRVSARDHEVRTHECDHIVGVYHHDDELITAIATFLTGAIAENGVAIVIATPSHRDAVRAALVARGHAVDELTRAGRYIALDASDTLAAFMESDQPDAAKFASLMGGVLEDAAGGGGPVRAFGEMVALLWDAGNIDAAIELESLWNDLPARHSFGLFCAYAMSSLETSDDLAATKQVCDRHTEVIRLARTHDGSSDCAGLRRAHSRDRLFIATPTVLRDVRRFVRETLSGWDDEQAPGGAEIIVSELATNAVKHARSPFRVSIFRRDTSIRIAVRDASFELPEELFRDADYYGGRGVRLVASLSGAWGTDEEPDGKTVWAEIARG